MAGLMDFLSGPGLGMMLSDVGQGLSSAGRGGPNGGFRMGQNANQHLMQQYQQKQQAEKMQGLMAAFGDQLSPQQRAFAETYPEMAVKLLGQTAYPKAQGGSHGLNIVWGQDEQGNWVPMQANKYGGLTPAQLPQGVSAVQPYNTQFLNTGTAHVPMNPRAPGGAAPAGEPVPINVQDEASERAAGGVQGKAEAERTIATPEVIAAGKKALGLVQSLKADPYLPNMTGYINTQLPNMSDDANRVQSKIDQLGGDVFMTAYKGLKGGGQITEIEGQKATQAQARLNSAQSYEDYVAALEEFEELVQYGITLSMLPLGAVPPDPPWLGRQARPAFAKEWDEPQFKQWLNDGGLVTNPNTGETMRWDGSGFVPD